MLDLRTSTNDKDKQAFLQEALIMQELDHPSLVRPMSA